MKRHLLTFLSSLWVAASLAQAKQNVQYPRLLSHSYFSVSPGLIYYPFSDRQLAAGFRSSSIRIPHAGVRLVLFGHEFTPHLSAQITYMRPVLWVEYQGINGTNQNHSVWMNVAGLTAKLGQPLFKKFSVYGEAGLGIITRKGFSMDASPVLRDASYATILSGLGLEYQLSPKWHLTTNLAYVLSNEKQTQPHILFVSGGFRYTLRPLGPGQIEKVLQAGYHFPRNLVQAGYITNAAGYGVNDFVSGDKLPVFWGGDAEVRKGFSLRYQHTVFHTRKVFSLETGASLTFMKSRRDGNQFFAFSLYPLFRFTALRTKPADLYFLYSVAGPSFISKTEIDGNDTGTHFTFQDLMGMGFFMGKKKNLNLEATIGHYSNGNLFPQNAGIKIPLSFYVGYGF